MTVKFYKGSETGDWNTAANWSTLTVPVAGDVAIVNVGEPIASHINFANITLWLNDNQVGAANPTPTGMTFNASNMLSTAWLYTDSSHAAVMITLHNVSWEGHVFSRSGSTIEEVDAGTSTDNSGWIGVAATSGTANNSVVANGTFSNHGGIQAGLNGIFTAVSVLNILNAGTIEADTGGRVNVQTFNGASLLNTGTIFDNGGIVAVTGNLYMAPTAVADIANHGTLDISGATVGGTIAITTGTLDFQNEASMTFLSAIDFQGPSATLHFDTANVAEAFNAATNILTIVGHFANGDTQTINAYVVPREHSSFNFSVVNGSSLVFTAHPVA